MITFRNARISENDFDALVLSNILINTTTNAYCVAYELHATRSHATRANIAASLARLVAAGNLVRDDFAVTGAAPAYRRIR